MPYSFCTRYVGSGTRWPTAPFPSGLFPGWKATQLYDAARAWNFFEQVESIDAATRVRLGAQADPWSTVAHCAVTAPSVWYVFKTQEEYTLYKKGQALHSTVCPDYSWTSQRDLGIPTGPVTNVFPAPC